MGVDAIAEMKPGAIISARRGMVGEAALADGLRSGHIARAGIIVFAEEPADPDHPLLSLPTVTADVAWLMQPRRRGGERRAPCGRARSPAPVV